MDAVEPSQTVVLSADGGVVGERGRCDPGVLHRSRETAVEEIGGQCREGRGGSLSDTPKVDPKRRVSRVVASPRSLTGNPALFPPSLRLRGELCMEINGQDSLSVVIPAHNEQATLAQVVETLTALPQVREVIVVDDASTDRTGEIGRELERDHREVRYVRHDTNGGKTEALRTGFALTHGDIVIIQDADLSTTRTRSPTSSRRSSRATPTWSTDRASWCAGRRVFSTSTTTSPTRR